MSGLAEVLGGHEFDAIPRGGQYVPACTCGWAAASEWSPVAVHDAHVAAAVAAWLTAPEQVERAARGIEAADAEAYFICAGERDQAHAALAAVTEEDR